MKPTVPETGTVLRIEGSNAVIKMKHEGSCKGCGMAAIGLCRASDNSLLLTATNSPGASVGDKVLVGLDQATKLKGYLMAYLAPLFGLLAGAIAGHLAGRISLIAYLDVLGGFAALLLSAVFSFRQLKQLNATHKMAVIRVLRDSVFNPETESEEERMHQKYMVGG